ncbi:MAG: septal ring lytic transglycosylase RlpA family protein [Alphaproteobacteria bacterium]|nr:septal ring lytic transglycosylase RlpA family protein [Alphaproteobacteria bacterium]
MRTESQMWRPRSLTTALAAVALLLGGCAGTTPTGEQQTGARGSPRGVYKVGNPYQISGVWYYPKEDYEYRETGIASWYGADFHGKYTANGEAYDMTEMTAAHRTLPLPSLVRVTNLDNGRSILLRVNDRGPFARSRIIDVSRRGAQLLGFERQGTAKVRVEIMADESRQLAEIYRGSGTIGQALARTPTIGEGGAVLVAASGSPPALAAAPAPVVAATPPLAVEAVPLPAPQMASAPRSPAAPVPAPSAPEVIDAAAAPPPVVTMEPVRRTQIFVQAGAFSQRANAERVRQNVTGAGAARVTTVSVSGAPLFRVRIGPMKSVEDADVALARVADAGYPEARIIVE